MQSCLNHGGGCAGRGLFKDMILEPQLCRWLCREDLFKDMMSEWEDVAAKHARCMAGALHVAG